MKTLSFLAILLMLTSFGFAQDNNDDAVEVEEEIQVDTKKDPKVFIKVAIELYPKTYPAPHDDGYWSQDGTAFLRAGFRPNSYEDFKSYMNTEISGFEILESKEIELDGIKFLYQKMGQNRAGKLVEIVSYIKKNDENSVIEVGGFYPKGIELIYKSAIENAAISAKLIEE